MKRLQQLLRDVLLTREEETEIRSTRKGRPNFVWVPNRASRFDGSNTPGIFNIDACCILGNTIEV
jgi:hypothetical protein